MASWATAARPSPATCRAPSPSLRDVTTSLGVSLAAVGAGSWAAARGGVDGRDRPPAVCARRRRPPVARSLGLDPDDLLDLAMTMNPVAPDPEVVVRRHLGSVRRYPDAREATAALAAVAGFDPERVLLTNGGAEAIALVAAELGGARVDEPEFSLYRRHLARIDPALPRFRSNPGNPGGLLAGPDEVAGAWDEAFYPLATGTWTRGDADRGRGSWGR